MYHVLNPLAKYLIEELRAMMIADPSGVVRDASVEVEDQESGALSRCM